MLNIGKEIKYFLLFFKENIFRIFQQCENAAAAAL